MFWPACVCAFCSYAGSLNVNQLSNRGAGHSLGEAACSRVPAEHENLPRQPASPPALAEQPVHALQGLPAPLPA